MKKTPIVAGQSVMQDSNTKPIGSVTMPSLLCALAGTLLAIGLDFMDQKLALGLASDVADFWETEPYFLTDPVLIQREVYWVLAFVFSWIIASLTLASAFVCRRSLVGLMLLSVLAALSPVLMVWGILWLPAVTMTAAIWAWFCAVIYGAQHTMPCELSSEPEAPESEVPDITMKVQTIPFPTKNKAK